MAGNPFDPSSGPQTVTIDGPQGYGLYTVDYSDPANPKILGFVGSTVRPSTGSTTVVNAPTAGHHYQTMYGDQGYGTYDDSVYPPVFMGAKPPPAAPASLSNDLN